MKKEKEGSLVNKKKIIITIILATVIFLTGGVGGFFLNRLTRSNSSNTIDELLRLIDSVGYIYDDETFEKKQLTTEELADALLFSLDEYATYYTPDEFSNLLKKREGRHNNLGIGFYDDDLQIDVCYYNSPAYKVGVRKGDKIVSGRLELDQEKQTFNDVYDFLDYFKGKTGNNTIHVTLERAGEFTEREFSFSSEQYEVVYASYKDNTQSICFKEENGERTSYKNGNGIENLPQDTAYIDLIGFEGKSAEQLEEAISIMKENGKTRLILDLRDNGGGQMSVLEKVAGSLIYNEGKSKFPIVYEEHKSDIEITYSGANANNDFIEQIVVLANEFSASATECLIGAMSYYCKTVFSLDNLIVEKNDDGEARTYGKGIMQTTYSLRSGGAFTLTTAKLFWPDDTCIHGVGIRPTSELNATEKGEALNRAIEILS